MENQTKYAPSLKQSHETIYLEHQELMSIPDLKNVLDALPYLSAILNEERQAIYVNQNILNFLGVRNIEEVIGERPGEMFGCIHSNKERGGCGTSENCRYCGAINAILKAQINQSKVIDECRISSVIGGKNLSFDLQIIATPAVFDGKSYIVLTLNDISSIKRKEVLEKIFFHDILNISSSLQGFVDLIQDIEDPTEIRSFMEQISKMVARMNDEIQSQRELVAAEKGDLIVKPEKFDLSVYLHEVIQAINHHESAIGKEIIYNNVNGEININADKALLSRVLVNMIKNALEAEPIGGTVFINCKAQDGILKVSVMNSKEIPVEVKMQIFQRSYSTKGLGRGIGTYSMKLICNQYLKGEISFISNKFEGTIFTLSLPFNYPGKA